jgi:hypothetical protein
MVELNKRWNRRYQITITGTINLKENGGEMYSQLIKLLSVSFISFMFSLSHAIASPTAEWLGPWGVVDKEKLLLGNATGKRAFGASPLLDGDIKDVGAKGELLPGTPARVNVEATVKTFSLQASEAETEVDFTRQFRLSGSPQGWNVSLDGLLRGMLKAENATFSDRHPSTSISFSAMINGTAIAIGAVDVLGAAKGASADREVLIPRHSEGKLPDGTYMESGSIIAKARVDQALIAGANASALFFDPAVATITASPVPEPSAWLLMITGLISLCAYCWRTKEASFWANMTAIK